MVITFRETVGWSSRKKSGLTLLRRLSQHLTDANVMEEDPDVIGRGEDISEMPHSHETMTSPWARMQKPKRKEDKKILGHGEFPSADGIQLLGDIETGSSLQRVRRMSW